MTTSAPVVRRNIPDRVYITSAALEVMRAEAQLHRATGSIENETGGVLFGRRLDRNAQIELLIVACTGPGKAALHQPIEFNPDVEYVNGQLQLLYAQFPRLDYIGTWHKHPPEYRQFSSGDVATTHEVFRDPSYKMYEVVNPIAWVNDDQVTIRFYYMNRPMAEARQIFEEIPAERIVEISDVDDLVLAETIPALSHLTRERLADERRRLIERGYKVDISQQDHTYYFTLVHEQLPEAKLYLIAPRGYPRVPPAVFAERNGKDIPADDGGVITGWMLNPGASFLTDIADGVLKNLLAPPGSTRPTNRFVSYIWLVIASLLVAVIASIAWLNWSQDQQRIAYENRWASIDQTILQQDEQTLNTVVSQLRIIQNADPNGTVYERNEEAKSILIETLIRLGNILLDTQPPQLDRARGAFDEANTLISPQRDTRIIDGLSKIQAARETVIAQEARWLLINNTTDLRQLVVLIEELFNAGVENDGKGKSTVERLIAAKIALSDSLISEKSLDAAQIQAQEAQELAQKKAPALLPIAVDALARVYLAQARELRVQGLSAQATAKIAALNELQPSQNLLREAATEQDLIVATQESSNAELLKQADQLQLEGKLNEARAIYTSLISSTLVKQRDIAQSRLTILSTAQDRWSKAGAAYDSRRWVEAIGYLDQLSGLAGFGPQAQRPEAGLTVAQLRAQALANIPPPTPRPLPTTTPELLPIVSPPPIASSLPTTVTSTPEPIALPTATETAPPAAVSTYQVSISEISLDELKELAKGANLAGVNAYIAGPSGLTLQIANDGGGSFPFSIDARLITLGSGLLTISVIDDPGEQSIRTIGDNQISPQANTYYKITIANIS